MFFPTMHLLHLHLWFRVALGFTLFSRLTHHRMPNAISVRQISGLPRASFRSRLATDTLASGYALGATSCARDFHPLEHAHAGRTEKKPRRISPTGLFLVTFLSLVTRLRRPFHLCECGWPVRYQRRRSCRHRSCRCGHSFESLRGTVQADRQEQPLRS